MNAVEVLKKYYGYDSFRDNQEEAINTLLNGQDLLAVMPTGAGKSICYQIPAILASGVSIVISPLISLMHDQILKLKDLGVDCAFINSTYTEGEYSKVKAEILNGIYSIIYIAPERLLANDFLYIASKLNISYVFVDEAHCVSQWGNDFRKAYRDIKSFVNKLSNRPVIGAFTATATPQVKDDISIMLGLNNPHIIVGSFDRPNLYFSKLFKNDNEKSKYVLDYVSRNKDKSGVVYCNTRAGVNDLYELLHNNGLSVGKYHAGLSDEERKQYQNDFVYDNIKVIVATNAFGMGIDKSNVSFVIHYNMPQDIESYYQEAGRAGRDGANAECILLYNGNDYRIAKFLLDKSHSENDESEIKNEIYANRLSKLDKMKSYANTTSCLRKNILNYFGEELINKCNNCINCKSNYHEEDITDAAKIILSFTASMNNRFGMNMLIDVLCGSNNNKVLSYELDKNEYFSRLKNLKKNKVKSIFDYLISIGYLNKTLSQYPVIFITKEGYNGLNSNIIIKMECIDEYKENNLKFEENPYQDLFYKLKDLRQMIATEKRVPAYIIFSDKTLEEMSKKLPTNEIEFLNISGVGESKLREYGVSFLKVICEYINSNNIKHEAIEHEVIKEEEKLDQILYEKLRQVRLNISNEIHSRAYIVLSNQELENLVIKSPRSIDDLYLVKGFGKYKVENYGERFISAINEYYALKKK